MQLNSKTEAEFYMPH